MQDALAIIAHALRMLIFDTTTTLRVLFPALVLVIASSVIGATLAGDAMLALRGTPEDILRLPPRSVFLAAVMGLVGLFGYALMAIRWHRHVLLSGMDRAAVMRPDLRIFMGYLGRALTLAAIQILAAIPIFLVIGLIIGLGGSALSALATTLGSFAFIWLALRLSLVLPAAALGTRMRVSDSWEATGSIGGTILGVSLLLTGLNLFTYTLIGIVAPEPSVLRSVIQTVIYIAEGLVFVSVLTTFYGHLIEGRALK